MKINKILGILDYYKKLTPLNLLEERVKFMKIVRRNRIYNPQFKYPEFKIDKIREASRYLAEAENKDPVIRAFFNLYFQISLLMIAITKEKYDEVTKISGEIFGDYRNLRFKRATNSFQGFKRKIKDEQKNYSGEKLKALFKKTLNDLNLGRWQIKFDSKNASEISIYEKEKKIIINPIFKFTQREIERILNHEIFGHAYQATNAGNSGKYRDFFLSYLGTEKQYEGLAVFGEINNLARKHIRELISRYLLLMIATCIAAKSSFHEVYQSIYQLTNDAEFAFMAALRAKRGFRDTSKKGSFQKENSYLIGVLEIIRLANSNYDNYLKLIRGSFPLSVINHLILPTKRKFLLIGVKRLNKHNMEFFASEATKFLIV